MRILYVEDTLLNLCLVERIVRMGDHEIVHYTYAEHALVHFAEVNPDIALVDIRLDGEMSGVDLVIELRNRGYTLPVVAITALASEEVRDRCLAAGCTEYFAKPLPVRRLVHLLEKYQQMVARKAADTGAQKSTN